MKRKKKGHAKKRKTDRTEERRAAESTSITDSTTEGDSTAETTPSSQDDEKSNQVEMEDASRQKPPEESSRQNEKDESSRQKKSEESSRQNSAELSRQNEEDASSRQKKSEESTRQNSAAGVSRQSTADGFSRQNTADGVSRQNAWSRGPPVMQMECPNTEDDDADDPVTWFNNEPGIQGAQWSNNRLVVATIASITNFRDDQLAKDLATRNLWQHVKGMALPAHKRTIELEMRTREAALDLLTTPLATHGVSLEFREALGKLIHVSLIGIPMGYRLIDIKDHMVGFGTLHSITQLQRHLHGRKIRTGTRVAKFYKLDEPIPKHLAVAERRIRVIYSNQEEHLKSYRMRQAPLTAPPVEENLTSGTGATYSEATKGAAVEVTKVANPTDGSEGVDRKKPPDPAPDIQSQHGNTWYNESKKGRRKRAPDSDNETEKYLPEDYEDMVRDLDPLICTWEDIVTVLGNNYTSYHQLHAMVAKLFGYDFKRNQLDIYNITQLVLDQLYDGYPETFKDRDADIPPELITRWQTLRTVPPPKRQVMLKDIRKRFDYVWV